MGGVTNIVSMAILCNNGKAVVVSDPNVQLTRVYAQMMPDKFG